MSPRLIGMAINGLAIGTPLLGASWRGFRRRRPYWSRGSWASFGGVVGAGLALLAAGLALASAFEHHDVWMGTRHSNLNSLWLLLLIGCLVGGTSVVGGAVIWLAEGEPTRQLTVGGMIIPRIRRKTATSRV